MKAPKEPPISNNKIPGLASKTKKRAHVLGSLSLTQMHNNKLCWVARKNKQQYECIVEVISTCISF